MKSKTIFLIVTMFVLFVSACGSSTTPAATTPEPTSTAAAPDTSGDPTWDRVQSAGKVVFGTSADYQPFSYYDESYEITGFDAALAHEIGARLGLQVELVDIAFESLPTALQIGQIDAAIAAISVSPERQELMDFTNVYFVSDDLVLARDDAGSITITSPEQLTPYRVGVQRGSIYAAWVQETLIDTKMMPEANLLQYVKAEDAVRDLRENRNDLVIMDKLAAEEYILEGGVISAGENLNAQLFAIALLKGAATLQDQLNTMLTGLQNDGTIARLTTEFLDIEQPIATPPPLPTSIPGPVATPAGCFDGMAFVADIKIPDGSVMQPGQDFDKVWRIRNTGTCNWDTGYKLVFVQGSQMDGVPSPVTTTVKPSETLDILIDQTAPQEPGKYTGIWQMVNKNGMPFGERIWVKITVAGEVQPTTLPPTATSVPPVQPTKPPEPLIDYLTVSSDTVNQGDLLVVSWSFSGVDLASARLTRTNPDGSETPLYGGADVDTQGQYEDLMMDLGTYTYTLAISSEFGGTTIGTVQVNVVQ